MILKNEDQTRLNC